VRLVLLAVAGVLFGVGWVAGVVWSGLLWSLAAVRVGFRAARRVGGD
jgi:hypothetical protein